MQKDHQPETADGLAYLWGIVGNCLTLFPINIETQLAKKQIQIKTYRAV